MTTTENTPESIFAELVAILTTVIGEDYLLDIEITRESTFSEDIALESVEFVALGQKLQDRYPGVNVAAFVADLDIDQIMAITVGDLVDYIERCLGAADSGH